MLLKHSPFFYPGLLMELHNLAPNKSRAPFLGKYVMKNDDITRRSFMKDNKIKVVHKIKALDMPLEVEYGNGIGITKYFEGKNIFITGATGFVGKVLVEKILRSTSVGKIYVMVKADDAKGASDRLTKELINSELFKCLQEEHGKFYEAFVTEKLIPVVGNVCESNLGMNSNCAGAIMEEVDVIISCAANTTLNGRYDLLIDTNVNGSQRLMRFAQNSKNLELLVHISTAFVNGEKEGIIMENPLIMGENRRKEDSEAHSSIIPRLDLAHEVNLASGSCTTSTQYDVTKHMRMLGMERAKLYGWYTAYHLTKALAEMVIHEMRGNVPVLIIRPTMIESCNKEPVPGWIQGNRVIDPIILSYGKGHLPAFIGNPNAPVDVIPVDLVVNATIAAIAKHGYMRKSELNIYQMASSVVNPLQYSDFFEILYEYFSSEPLIIESQSFTRINNFNEFTKIKYFDNFDDFSQYTREEIFRRLEAKNGVGIDVKKTQKQCKAKVTYAEQLCKMYEFLGCFNARFDAGNTQKLLSEMSKEEQINFPIDVTKIDWRKYLIDVHIPGLRQYVLKDQKLSNNSGYD